MKARHHLPSLLALVLAAAAFVIALAVSAQILTGGQVTEKAKGTLLTASVRAANAAANNAPTLGCNPATGGGKLGACAPQIGPSATLAKAAGDPFTIHGLLGVDVSSYQGCQIDWRRQGVAFAFFKASEGTGYTDACLRHNVASAKAAHLPYGAYDFLRPSFQHSAREEAAHFVAAVRAAGANTSLPPVADVEANAGLSGAAVHAYVCAWHAYVRHALHRPVTVTYTGNWFWGPQVAGDACGSRLWVSAYANYPVIPHGWSAYAWFQYSDGVFGPYPHLHGWDSDRFYGSRAQLLALAGTRPKPVSRNARIRCARLVAYRHHRRHSHRASVQAAHDRAALIQHGYRCSNTGKAIRK